MTLERGSPHDEAMNGGNQPTDMSLIHRRCTFVTRHPIDLQKDT